MSQPPILIAGSVLILRMIIEKDRVVTMDYTLKDDAGKVLDSSSDSEPLAYIQGAGAIVAGLENELEGKVAGDSLAVSVKPEDGYGTYNDELQFPVSKDQFEDSDQVETGMHFQADLDGKPHVLTVMKVNEEDIIVDANHPLAGMTLHFEIEVRGVRAATDEELEHGHVHTGEHHH